VRSVLGHAKSKGLHSGRRRFLPGSMVEEDIQIEINYGESQDKYLISGVLVYGASYPGL